MRLTETMGNIMASMFLVIVLMIEAGAAIACLMWFSGMFG